MAARLIGPEIEPRLDWLDLVAAIEAGHDMPKAQITDSFLYRGADTLLSRAAWVDGLGALVKTATVFPENRAPVPGVNGAASLFSDADGQLEAMIDFHLLTKWKTAADSLLAARRLAPSTVRSILIVGAGTVARSMIQAYRAGFPQAHIRVWNRSVDRLSGLEQQGVEIAPDLEQAVPKADVICTATMSTDPVIQGAWLRPGQHLDLIGAFRADMREVDDTALRRARLFVDSRETTLHHIGELKIPLESGAMSETDVIADYYDLNSFARRSDEDITISKNGGGAHLDLMTALYILRVYDS